MTEPQSFYDAVGGAPTFRRIVARFYEQVADDEILRPLYPEEDLTGAEDRLRCSWSSTGAGRAPTPISVDIPRLRMRHVPYRIGPIERDAWLRCMHTAIAEIDATTLDDAHRRALLDFPEMAADSMMNSRSDVAEFDRVSAGTAGCRGGGRARAEPGVDAQPGRCRPDPHHFVDGHGTGREVVGGVGPLGQETRIAVKANTHRIGTPTAWPPAVTSTTS